ncbi:MAG: Na+/H+ antiporter, partial [Mycobacterium sp.]|nr:Na+/H+ antiporter [Mycobacterium sp.]
MRHDAGVAATIALALGGLVVLLAVTVLAGRTGLPSSVLLVVAGLAYGFLPGPNLGLDPEVVLMVVIPPLLYAAALESSLVALRGSARAVGGLSVGLVAATALAVGAGVSAAVAAVPLSAGVS